MALEVTCPHCSAQFETPDSFAGKMGKCPICGRPFRAPQASVSSSALPKATPLRKATPLPESSAPTKPANAGITSKSAPRHEEVEPVLLDSAVDDDAPAFSPLVVTTPSGPVSKPGAPAASNPLIRPPAPQAGIPIWGWIGGGVALVLLLGAGVYAITSIGNNPVATVPRQPGPLDKDGGKGPILTADWGKARTVKSLEDATSAMVKIVTPTRRGTMLGSGFVINNRGWIATNHHVIMGANANSRALMSDGTSYELAPGVIVDVPELDMAIIKFKDPPFQLTVFELQSASDPKLGAPIFCYGHPRGVDFSVVDGVVGRVVQSKDLDEGGQNFVYTKMRSKPDMIWIQHSAPIQPGNSGGPVIDKQSMKVIGVNTWVNQQVNFGYAGHVKYLQTLISTAKEELKPFPPADEAGSGFPDIPEEDPSIGPNPGPQNPAPPVALVLPVRDITAQKVSKQFDECEKLKWQPTTAGTYGKLSELAKLLVTAKELSLNANMLPNLSAEDRKGVSDAGDEVFRKVAALDWSGELPTNMSRLAVKALDQPGMGVLAVARRVPGQAGRPNIVLFDLEGTPVLAEMPPGLADKAKEGRVLIVGMTTPIGMRIQLPNSQLLSIKVVRVNYLQSLSD